MAKKAGTFQTYQSIGNREDLADRIYNISPADTPFMSNGGRGSCDAVLFEWQEDSLVAVDTGNKHIEGDETAFDSVTPTVRRQNYVQISKKSLIVSRTQEKIRKAGRKSEVAYQLAKISKELKRDMEAILLSNQGASAGNATTARQTGSLLAFLKTNTDFAGDGADPTYTSLASGTRTDGTQRAFTETQVKSVLSACWASGASPRIVMVGAFNKQAASAFTGIAQIRKAVEGAKAATIIGAADVYVSDFGNVTFVPNRFMRARDALVLDPEMYEVAYLDSFAVTDQAKTGDTAAQKLLTVEYGLKVGAEAAHGGIFDLTTS